MSLLQRALRQAPDGLPRVSRFTIARILHEAGLITTRKVGRVRTCALEPAAVAAAEGWLAQHRGRWEQRLDRLGDVLAGLEAQDPGGGAVAP